MQVFGEAGEFTPCAKHKQMVLLWKRTPIVQFLSDQDQDPSIVLDVVPFHRGHADVVIGDQDRVDSLAHGRAGQILVAPRPVRVPGVHVKIQEEFDHGPQLQPLVDDFLCAQV
jgi:hypothetical protein